MQKIIRHNFLTLTIFFVIGLIPSSQQTVSAQTSEIKNKLNVLFIAIDDLNDWIGSLEGYPDVRTPNLDRLAQQSMIFTNAHCPAPLCNASRAALMTGIRPSTSGVYKNANPWRQSPVLKNAITLPQHFMDHGYTSIGSGKIYHGRFPDPQSWDIFWPSKDKQSPDDPMPENRPLNGISNTRHFDWGPVPVDKDEMGDWLVASWITDQLKKEHDKPFFLACGFFRPHLPWYVPQEYFDLYPLEKIILPNVNDDDLDDIPRMGRKFANPDKDHANVLAHKQWRKAVQSYLASISFVDECVGRVIDALENSAYREKTVIVLWSDHGWHLGEKLHWRKFALWEEATHNVLMFNSPGTTRPGSSSNAAVNLLDIYPTLIELCGLQQKPELEGVSLLPLLRNPDHEWDRPTITTFGRNNHSVRSKRWRYIRYADGSEELYDHDNDQLEWNNLAGQEKYIDVKKELAQWLPEVNVMEVIGY